MIEHPLGGEDHLAIYSHKQSGFEKNCVFIFRLLTNEIDSLVIKKYTFNSSSFWHAERQRKGNRIVLENEFVKCVRFLT